MFSNKTCTKEVVVGLPEWDVNRSLLARDHQCPSPREQQRYFAQWEVLKLDTRIDCLLRLASLTDSRPNSRGEI